MSTLPSGSPHPRFGDLLRRFRVARGLTQERLAERSGLSVRGISDLERGVRNVPYRETILRLITALELAGDEEALLLSFSRRGPRPGLLAVDAGWSFGSTGRAAVLDEFVGRDPELTAILQALDDPHHRLLTLTGPPGVGKTRLAIEATWRFVERTPAEIIFVDLAPIRNSLLVLPAIAAAAGVREAKTPALPDRLQARLAMRLATHPAVLVLDNFEHLLAATSVVGDLLQASPDARLLVTSREPLRIRGEQVMPVPTLATPQLTAQMVVRDVAGHEAVALFIARARESDPAFQLSDENARAIAELCVRLDGLPLAIELAAARSHVLPPAAMMERLAQRRPVLSGGRRDLPERQRTLADAIAWSYELLGKEEQRLFRLLSVFLGGFTLEAAEYVGGRCAEGVAASPQGEPAALPPQGESPLAQGVKEHEESVRSSSSPLFPLERSDPAARSAGTQPSSSEAPPSVYDGLVSLVDKSLLVRQPGRAGSVRFGMLETIREYGLEQLAASGEEETARETAAEYYLAFAEEVVRDVRAGPAQRVAIERLEDEHDNLRQVLTWALEQADPARSLRLTEALWRFWWLQGYLSEGRRWLQRALERGRDAPPAARAKTLIAAGRLAWLRGELALAKQWLEEALALGPEPFDQCEALNALGDVARHQRDYERAEATLADAMDLARAEEDWFHLAASLHNLGTVELDRGDHDRASSALEEGLAYARQEQSWYLACSALHYLSRVAFEQGNYTRSAALVRENLLVQRELAPTAPLGAMACLEGVALLAVVQNQPAPAARMFGAGATLRDRAEDIERPERKQIAPWIACAREDLGEEAFTREWAAGCALSLEVALAEAAELLATWSWTDADDPATNLIAGASAPPRTVVTEHPDRPTTRSRSCLTSQQIGIE